MKHSDTLVMVGMSGGVDSSVTALLLLEQGYQVEGLFMKNWEEDDGSEYCTAKEDLADAQAVCARLGIKLHTANFAAEYWDNVFEYFLAEYKAGRTPNPDILCNREIKFNVFQEYSEMLGADLIATGHYARLALRENEVRLLKGLDAGKDQSYFLHAVSQSQFQKVLFPIGELNKSEVRLIASKHGLENHAKKDSTGICFIGERRFKDFLKSYVPAHPGPIITAEGKKIGEHEGLMYHTIGQRQGLGIGGLQGFPEEPWYVADKLLDTNELVVVQGKDHKKLFSRAVEIEAPLWIRGTPPELPWNGFAKIRYRQQEQKCTVSQLDPNHLLVDFECPQRAAAEGQFTVFYEKEECLGGGAICRTLAS